MSAEGQRTPFYEMHIRDGARMVNFAGFAMPIFYRSIIAEHRKVRSSVGLFDLSHMGEIEVRGAEALRFVQKVTTNDVSRLAPYQVQYAAMCYPDGGIVDDLLVYRLVDYFLLVVNATNIAKDFNWLKENLEGDVELDNLSDQMSLLALQGPRAEDVLAKLTGVDLKGLRYYWATWGKVDGVEMLFSRTGYTGEDGFELYFPSEFAAKLWDAVKMAGSEYEIEPIGLGARDSLRLEMGYCLYGNDIDSTTNPLQAGLSWITKLGAKDFIGKRAILEQKERGIKKRLMGIELEGRAFPRKGYPIFLDGKERGKVTSGIFSPSLNKGIAMGYLPVEASAQGSKVQMEIRGKLVAGEVVKPPFYKRGSHR